MTALERLIWIPYDEHSTLLCKRIYQITKLFLFNASSGMVSCPLAMTDGAAYILNKIKEK